MDKLKYFEIEEDIADLKTNPDADQRKTQLDELLGFLGANPIEKIDNAFKEKYGVGVLEYLNLAG